MHSEVEQLRTALLRFAVAKYHSKMIHGISWTALLVREIAWSLDEERQLRSEEVAKGRDIARQIHAYRSSAGEICHDIIISRCAEVERKERAAEKATRNKKGEAKDMRKHGALKA